MSKRRWLVSQKEILQLAKDKQALSITTTANAFNISYPTAKKYLLRLAKEGKLKKIEINSEKGTRTYRTFVLRKYGREVLRDLKY